MRRRHRSFAHRRHILVSLVTACATLVIQLPMIPRAADSSVPLPPLPEVIGIQQTEAQPAPLEPGLPVRLEIPQIEVDAQIVTVGLTGDEEKLDVPADRADAGWYELGARPGENGNAVLDGHLEIGGAPGIFWYLRYMQPGDAVYVTDDQGIRRTFRIRESVVYDVDNAPMQKIFGASSKKQLNLITCAGVWDDELGHYDKRLIVYTELEE